MKTKMTHLRNCFLSLTKLFQCFKNKGNILLSLVLFFLVTNAYGQTAPVLPPSGGFHIDGNLKANTPTAGIGDWVNGAGGTGGYLINDNGTVVNTLITFNLDDPYSTNTDIIFTGGSKVNDNPVDWDWSSQSAPPKNDINHGLIHISKDINDDIWLIMAGDRLSTNGDAYIDFELLQNTMTRNTTNGHFNTAGPDNGRTVNDLLITIEYSNGGGVSNITYRKWLPDGTGFSYQVITPGPLGFAVTNSSSVDVPFGAFGNTTYDPLQFVEAAVNLSQVIHNVTNGCQGMDIKTLFIKTKASTSPTAELKDFIEPLQLDMQVDEVLLAAVNPLCVAASAVTLVGSPSGGTYSGPGVSGSSFNPAIAGPGMHTIIYSKEVKPGCFRSDTITIQVDPASVGGVVATGTTVCFGSVDFGTLTLNGHTGAVLKWQYSINGGTTWIDIANTSTSQTYSNLTQTTMYRAVVQSGVCNPANSNPATITVDPASVGGSVAAGATVCSGSNGGTLTLSGQTGAVVKWQYSTDGGANWIDIANTTTSQAYSNLTQTTMYRAVVQSGVCSPANSSPATITVDPASVGGSVAAGATVCSGSNGGTLTLSGQTGAVVKWQYSTDGGANWIDIANTTTSQTYSNLTQTTMYRAVVQSGVCSPANSSPATITVDPASVGGSVAAGATVCSGSNGGTLTLSGQTGAVVKWQYSTDNGANWIDIANTTTSQTYSNLTQTTMYRAVVQSGVCNPANSSPATITVDPASVGGSVAAGATVCSGSNGGTLTLSGQTGAVLKWQYSINGGTTWIDIANTTTSQAYSNLTQTTMYRAVVQSGVCNPANSSPATINVDLPPVGGTVNNTMICAITESTTLTLSGYSGTIMMWQSSEDGGSTWVDIANTGNTLNVGPLTATMLFRAVVGNGVCANVNSAPGTVQVINCQSGNHCTYTQGFYGNLGGLGCSGGDPDGNTMENSKTKMLNAFDLAGLNKVVFGKANIGGNPVQDRAFTLFRQDIVNNNIYLMLPGGGTPAVLGVKPGGTAYSLPYEGATFSVSNTWNAVPIAPNGSTVGKIKNILLAQTMALFFNMNNGTDLAGFALHDTLYVTSFDCISGDPVPGAPVLKFALPHNVLAYMYASGGTYPVTVAGLYQLANDKLGGVASTSIGAADITNAVDVINNAFDGCRSMVGYYDLPVLQPVSGNMPVAAGWLYPSLSVQAYPNPFTDKIVFNITAGESSACVIEIYNMVGQRVHTLEAGNIMPGKMQIVEFKAPPILLNGNFVYLVKAGTQRASGKLISIGRQ